MDTTHRNYNSVALFYEQVAGIFSFGKIWEVKASQVYDMRDGSKALYVGVGTGEDAILAGHRGINITCIDIAPAMIEKAKIKFKDEGLTGEFICGDVSKHDRPGYYDTVTANFFLNIFTEDEVKYFMSHLVKFIKPGGKFMIADFSLPHGGFFSRITQGLYYKSANRFFRRLGLAPFHPIYDYAKLFPEFGLELDNVKHFPLFKCGPSGFDSITAIRK